MSRADQAKEYFLSGCNCAQAVSLAFRELVGVPGETLKALALPFGGGIGRLRQTCGGVTGAVLLVGLLFPDYGKSEVYAVVQEIASRFAQKNGSFLCGELLRGVVDPAISPQAEERTAAYYKKRPCAELVFDAAQILEEICKERGRL